MSDQYVAIGLSGGVDSAVAAALLKKAGFQVLGVSMKIWDGRPLPQETESHGCYGSGEVEDIEDARRISAALNIPFYELDLSQDFNQGVLNLCSKQYYSGITPNPCVYCNRKLKFELIPEKLRQQGHQVDFFATGHYANTDFDQTRGRYLLKRGRDQDKDQSYFLYQLTQEQLSQTLFPLGQYTKADIRKFANELSLPVAEKPESQDFVSGGYHTVFGEKSTPGPIVDQTGNKLGEHRGIQFYTIGQRRGLNISHSEPLYVAAIDAGSNTIIAGPVDSLYQSEFVTASLNWIAVTELRDPLPAEVRIRYRHKASPATLYPVDEGRKVKVQFQEPQRAITPGQAAVFYNGDTVVGGGIIERIE
jgi:tRNA-uridine 2-sulfurtransferase